MYKRKRKPDALAETMLLRLEAWGLDVATDVTDVWPRLDHHYKCEAYFKLRALGLSAHEVATLVVGKHLPGCACWDCIEALRAEVVAHRAGRLETWPCLSCWYCSGGTLSALRYAKTRAMYAAHTRVPVDQTKTEIERTLARYGADRFAYFTEVGKAAIVFESHNRRLRFDLPLPVSDSERDNKARRQKWRALLLCIKAKLESVESKIETFEEAFLAHVVMPDGKTVGAHAVPAIAEAYDGGRMVPLLPAPH